jgi:flap endonuclease-1
LLKDVPYEAIRRIFLSPEVPMVSDIVFGDVNRERVLDFLCVEKSFSTDRVSGQLDKLQKSLENKSQSLEQWFS